ncbi:MAG: TetR/AcrR family transcriptional regulator [Candidatus Abyssobacteria bacterium SURF_5]|uniref:TetR/AcrR family transcriptional regulator n=1 Tax=Abyssobacteria bacterium (strain SURF_5) TaxID=2093360 RepID=A0A3A4P482_ABYX5|nr:MAG: TetR/AcrR family transcriptional regulator [Candidatus Abyssubacteria bacterium SURF_5]
MQRQLRHSKSTRERLIEAAGKLFSEKGFKETTVKDITDVAEANVAAVNYYFRDKESLYEDVMISILEGMRESFPVDKDMDDSQSAESRLQTLVRNLLYRFLDPERPAWQGVLLAHERMAPRPAVLSIINEEIAKTRHLLSVIVRDLLGERATGDHIELCGSSVMGQIMSQAQIHSPQAPPLLRKGTATRDEVEFLARHIANFSLAGILRVRQDIETEKAVG